MAISKSVLGMNARNFIYIKRYNHAQARQAVDDKIKTKSLLFAHGIATASLIAEFPDRRAVKQYDWQLPAEGFAVKPARGYGGEGILAFQGWQGEYGTTLSGKRYTRHDFETHLLDILDGIYSLQHFPDRAYLEELIMPNAFFRSFAPLGLPDIRIIVFHRIPVMAMMRLPTLKSEGKANLHQGAIGIGIDIRTGIAFHATAMGQPISRIPGTNRPVTDIHIPEWERILLIAAATQAASGLGFAGVDIVIDERRGPLVLEVNARPGLSIQLVNQASLRTRLERIEDIDIDNPARGVEIAKALFAESALVHLETIPQILSVIEPVTLDMNGDKKIIEAKIDTGAYRTSLDESLVEALGLAWRTEDVFVKSASGQHARRTVAVTFELRDKKITTIASVAQRSHLQFQMIVGRKDLAGFLVNPNTKIKSPAQGGAFDRHR